MTDSIDLQTWHKGQEIRIPSVKSTKVVTGEWWCKQGFGMSPAFTMGLQSMKWEIYPFQKNVYLASQAMLYGLTFKAALSESQK